jgi:hypothetical protein
VVETIEAQGPVQNHVFRKGFVQELIGVVAGALVNDDNRLPRIVDK